MLKKLVLMLLLVGTLMASIDINKATKAELMGISGIGEKKAEAIIKYRKQHGKFKSVDDLKKVNGIGDTIVTNVKKGKKSSTKATSKKESKKKSTKKNSSKKSQDSKKKTSKQKTSKKKTSKQKTSKKKPSKTK
jgi:competence protein ComEA